MKRKTLVFGAILTIVILFLGIGLPAAAAQDATEVTIDIKPCKDPNVLNVNVIGPLPVAINGIYKNYVDPDTVTLEGIPILEDDGWKLRPDYLLVKFPAEDVIATFGQVENGEVLTLYLEGQLFDGTPIEGSDEVVILKRGKKVKP